MAVHDVVFPSRTASAGFILFSKDFPFFQSTLGRLPIIQAIPTGAKTSKPMDVQIFAVGTPRASSERSYCRIPAGVPSLWWGILNEVNSHYVVFHNLST